LKKPKPHFPDLTTEVSLGFLLPKMIIGVDEVGRGCLAGPVVAAAAVLPIDAIAILKFLETGGRPKKSFRPSRKIDRNNPPVDAQQSQILSDHSILLQVRDSKLIPEEERPAVEGAVKRFVREFAVGEASVEEIERLNILYASHLAMERAVAELERKLGIVADVILIDGHLIPKAFKGRAQTVLLPVIKGDLKCLSIACASIIAKVYRDDLMAVLDEKYPGYAMKQNKGYPTPFHKKQIIALGATEIHRKTFAGVMGNEAPQIAPELFDREFF
jgi:ribonuclease HII